MFFARGNRAAIHARLLPFQEDRIAELVSSVAVIIESGAHPPQHRVVSKRAQQLVMAVAWLVNAADDGVDDAELTVRPEPLVGDARTGGQAATRSGVLQSARHRRAEGDHATARRGGLPYRAHRILRNPVRLIERQPTVKYWVAGRRQPGGVGQRRLEAARGSAETGSPIRHRRNPAEGGSNDTGSDANRVQTSHRLKRSTMCAY